MSKGWCLIPPNILCDRTLSDSEKMLYGKLLGLTNKTGYCWATNKYLGSMFDTSERSIQRRIGKLIEKGYVTTEYDGTRRLLRVAIQGVTDLSGGDKIDRGDTTDLSPLSIKEMNKENNTKLSVDLAARKVWKYWGTTRADALMAKGLLKRRRIPPLSKERRRAVAIAIESGYSEDEMCKAVDAVMASDYHLENGHTDLTLCLRLNKIEQYLAWSAKSEVDDKRVKDNDLEEFV